MLIDKYSLIVTGNGFDIALNLPTKYENFLERLAIADKSLNFANFQERNSDIQFLNDKELLSFFNLFVSLKRRNYFVRYFLAYPKNLDRWCDVETEIKNIVLTFDTFLFNVSKAPLSYSRVYRASILGVPSLHVFNKMFVPQWNGFGFRSDDDYNTGSLIDTDYTGQYTQYDLKNRLELIRTNIAEGLFDDLVGFKRLFAQYLKCYVDCNHLICPKGLETNHLITYNYTSASELCVPHKGGVFYIHGKDRDMVLGTGVLTGLHDTRFNSFSKLSQRSGVQERSVINYISEVSVIGYIGFSFNENDKETINLYFKQNGTKHIVYYLNESAKNDLINNIMKIIGPEKYNELLSNDLIVFKESSQLFN